MLNSMNRIIIFCLLAMFLSCSREAEEYRNEDIGVITIKQYLEEMVVEETGLAHRPEELSIQDIISQLLPILDSPINFYSPCL